MEYYKIKHDYELEKLNDTGDLLESYSLDQGMIIHYTKSIQASKKQGYYKTEGHKILLPDKYQIWDNFVSTIYGKGGWIQSCIIEAVLKIVQVLEENQSIEEAYEFINIYKNKDIIYNELALTENMVSNVCTALFSLHPKAEEFIDYSNRMKNEYRNKDQKNKQKSKLDDKVAN